MSPNPTRVRKASPEGDPRYRTKIFGKIEPGDVHIFIRSDVLKQVVDYGKENGSRMVGGVLVGDPIEGAPVPTLLIDGYIPALAGQSTGQGTGFKFTRETWEDMEAVRAARFPDDVIVGWQITLPSFGVFMSGMNVKLHTDFFNLPYQVHLAVDPLAGKLGFFGWRGREIVKTGFVTYTPVPQA